MRFELLFIFILFYFSLFIIYFCSGGVEGAATIYASSTCPSGGGQGTGSQSNPYCDLNLASSAVVTTAATDSTVTLNIVGTWTISSAASLTLPSGTTFTMIGASPTQIT